MIEEELLVLEKYTDHLIEAYQALQERYENLKRDYNELSANQQQSQILTDGVKTKIETLVTKLRKIEEAHE